MKFSLLLYFNRRNKIANLHCDTRSEYHLYLIHKSRSRRKHIDKLLEPRWALMNFYFRAGDEANFWRWAKAAGRRRLPRAVRPFRERRPENPLPPARARPSILRSRHQRRRRCARRPRLGQAALSFTTHSGGRASPGLRSAAYRYSVEQ